MRSGDRDIELVESSIVSSATIRFPSSFPPMSVLYLFDTMLLNNLRLISRFGILLHDIMFSLGSDARTLGFTSFPCSVWNKGWLLFLDAEWIGTFRPFLLLLWWFN